MKSISKFWPFAALVALLSAPLAAQAYDLDFYELTRTQKLKPSKSWDEFDAKTGIHVTARDEHGNAIEGELRVLSDNLKQKIRFVCFERCRGDKVVALKPVEGDDRYASAIIGLNHGMQYRIELDGKQALDPSANVTGSLPVPATSSWSAAFAAALVAWLGAIALRRRRIATPATSMAMRRRRRSRTR